MSNTPQNPMDFKAFTTLTFDCYGTLIDWERGLIEALQPWLASYEINLSDEAVLEHFARFEAEIEKGPFMAYRDVLTEAAEDFLTTYRPGEPMHESPLPDSVGTWPPFPDTVAALRRLSAHYRLVILSNIDDDMIEETAQLLQVPFHRIITAQQVESYKPNPNNFRRALEILDTPADKVLHVAQSLYHDIAPARALGFQTVWVNRRKGQTSGGATPPSDAQPHLEVSSLKELADLVDASFRRPV